jgi:hypothetical protein
MIYAKEIIQDKFWIVKDDNINVATLEKKEDNLYLLIKDNEKQTATKEQLTEVFGLDVFSSQAKVSDVIKELSDFDGYPTKVKPCNVEWKSNIPTFTKTPSGKETFCAGYYGVQFEGGTFFSFNPKLETLTEKCIEWIGPFKNEMEANINISSFKKKQKMEKI